MGDPFNILLQRRGVLTSRNSTFLNSFLCVQKPLSLSVECVVFALFLGPDSKLATQAPGLAELPAATGLG